MLPLHPLIHPPPLHPLFKVNIHPPPLHPSFKVNIHPPPLHPSFKVNINLDHTKPFLGERIVRYDEESAGEIYTDYASTAFKR